MPPVDPAGWTLIPNFGHDSREFFCSVSGQPKRPEDPGVYRGSLVEMEGFYDICHQSAVQLGRLAGLVDPEEAEILHAENIELRSKIEELEKHQALLQAALDSLKALEDAS
jgi:hypothetical protein